MITKYSVHYSGQFLKDKLVKAREKPPPSNLYKTESIMNAHGTIFCVINHEIGH